MTPDQLMQLRDLVQDPDEDILDCIYTGDLSLLLSNQTDQGFVAVLTGTRLYLRGRITIFTTDNQAKGTKVWRDITLPLSDILTVGTSPMTVMVGGLLLMLIPAFLIANTRGGVLTGGEDNVVPFMVLVALIFAVTGAVVAHQNRMLIISSTKERAGLPTGKVPKQQEQRFRDALDRMATSAGG